MTEQRARRRFLDTSGLSMDEAEELGSWFIELQHSLQFWIGDLARYSERAWPADFYQVWPADMSSPGVVDRPKGVCQCYPNEADRQIHATYSQYRMVGGKPDRLLLLQAMVDAGMTTDESRAAQKGDNVPSDDRPRRLIAVDVNLYLHKFYFSGAGVEAAFSTAAWIERLADRLVRDKGVTDLCCCFDSPTNHRKQITADAGWEDAYKDRPPKDREIVEQLTLVRELIDKLGYCTVSLNGFEADDIMCSLASQFRGQVILLTEDKDMRQCLSATCNILLGVEWEEDETSGEMLPNYDWLTAKTHTEKTSIKPSQWCDYQAIMGDQCDNIKGAVGIGKKTASDLIQKYGTVEAAIQATKDGDKFLPPKKRQALIDFEEKLEVTRLLVTLRTDLDVTPNATRIT